MKNKLGTMVAEVPVNKKLTWSREGGKKDVHKPNLFYPPEPIKE